MYDEKHERRIEIKRPAMTSSSIEVDNGNPIHPLSAKVLIGDANEKHKSLRAYNWMMLSRLSLEVKSFTKD